jgi:hypothetical protein
MNKVKVRNHVTLNMLKRNGAGAHRKSNKALRKKANQNIGRVV